MNKEKTLISPDHLGAVRGIIEGMAERYGARFAPMDEVVAELGERSGV